MADTQNRMSPYKKISDVDVIMTVERPLPLMGLGNILILNAVKAKSADNTPAPNTGTDDKDSNADTPKEQSDSTPVASNVPTLDVPNEVDPESGLLLSMTDPETGAVYKEYTPDLSVVQEDYPSGGVLHKADGYLAQKYTSDRVAVLSYPEDQVEKALEAFWFNNWTFAVLANTDLKPETYIKLSNIFEANKDHFLLIQRPKASDIKALGLTGDNHTGADYTIGIVHKDDEAMDSAIIGATASKTVGSVTWKFRQLEGITPDNLTTGQLAEINVDHCIAYISVDGVGETTEGCTLSGEYIDNLHGDIWIKSHIQSELQRLLQLSDKIPYEQSGINLIVAKVTQVLETAWEQGIILTNDDTKKGDYSVSATPRKAQSQADLSKRHYGGISFVYHRSGAIHTVTVNGTVKSDTIVA